MSSDEQEIRRAWRALGGDDASVDDLLARHREPHRRYHSVTHVARVLRTVEELIGIHHVDDPDTVRAAALFHDAVYDPTAADNEQRSADLATRSLSALGWTAERCDAVGRLVLATATATHDAAGPDADVLLDADLAVLGADPSVYQAYVRGVRAEYAHVDGDAWRTGRAAVLRSFLERDRIFRTPTMSARAERRARANLAAELAELGR